MQAVAPIVKRLTESGLCEIVLTTTTSTGYKIASDSYSGNPLVHIGIFPIDFWLFSWRAWNKIAPDLSILMESEIWPEHLHQAKKRKIPVALINARLSDRSFARYSKVSGIAKRLFSKMTVIGASSEDDAQRLIALGCDKERVHVTGNLKFDVTVQPQLSDEEKIALRMSVFGIDKERANKTLVLLGSSTWPGEEALLISCYRQAKTHGIDCKLFIVPRHAERRKEIKAFIEKTEFTCQFRSEQMLAQKELDMYIADTTGELRILSQIADVAFIGKSIPPNNGGQTPIECAVLGIPIVYGPNMSNFRPLCRSLEACKAAIKANDLSDAQNKLVDLMKDADARKAMSKAASNWHDQNKGATDQTVALLRNFL